MTVTPTRGGRRNVVIEHRVGIDRRATTHSDRMFGRLGWGAYYDELAVSALGLYANRLYDIPARYVGTTPPGFRPFAVEPDDMPYALDDGDEPFGDDCRFVCYAIEPDNGPLVAYNPLAASYFAKPCLFPKRLQWWTYVAYGIPAAASCTLTLKAFAGTTSEVIIGTAAVDGADGPQQWIVLPAFDGVAPTTDVPRVYFAWTGGTPTSHGVISSPRSRGHYYAVPKTLPVGYTARSGADDQFTQPNGVFPRDCDHPGRQRTGPYVPPANYWQLGSAVAFQTEPNRGAMWFDLIPDGWRKRYTYWWPTTDQTVQEVEQFFQPDLHFGPPLPGGFTVNIPPPSDVGFTGTGWRKVTLHASAGGTDGRSFTYTITRGDTGAVVATLTFTEAELIAGTTKDVGTDIIPATNTLMTLSQHVTDQPFPYVGGGVTTVLRGHPRLDIPLPFNAVNEQNSLIPGGYDPATLFVPTNQYPLLKPDLGVTSVTQDISGQPIAFLPEADGWYRVTDTTGLVGGVGEHEFRWGTRSDLRTADRGHRNRRFYAFPTDTINPSVLSSFTPSFTVIAGAGTQLETTVDGVWAYGLIALPQDGTYQINVRLDTVDHILRGLVVEGTADQEDRTCLNPQWRQEWEPRFVGGTTQTAHGMDFKGFKSKAPLAPSTNDFWIMGDDADGAFGASPTNAFSAFQKNDIVAWSDVIGNWVSLSPLPGMVAITLTPTADLYTVWYDGAAWRDFVNYPVITRRITVPEATNLYLTFSSFDHRFITTNDHPKVTIWWTRL